MYSLLRFVLVVSVASIAVLATVRCQDLEAVQCTARFPHESSHMSSIYVGQGKIYVFGGYTMNGGLTKNIYLYDIESDNLAIVGELLNATQGVALAEDSQGNLLHFGGSHERGPNISRFNPSTQETELVGPLPKNMMTFGSFLITEDTALVFGDYDIMEVNLRTYQVTEIRRMVRESRGMAWDGGDRVLLFGNGQLHSVYSISGNTLETFTSPERHEFQIYHSVVSTPKSAFVVGNRGNVVGRGNGIFEVDFQTLEFTFWEVANYPSIPSRELIVSATTYVPELHRMYMFGGWNSTYRREIWYIDLPGHDGIKEPLSPYNF